VTLRTTKPCRLCTRQQDCAAFIAALRAVVEAASFVAPDVVLECPYFTPRRRSHDQ